MTLRSAGHWQEKRSKTRHNNLKTMLTRLYEDELKYKNLSTKINTFHARVFDVSKIKIYLFFKTVLTIYIFIWVY